MWSRVESAVSARSRKASILRSRQTPSASRATMAASAITAMSSSASATQPSQGAVANRSVISRSTERPTAMVTRPPSALNRIDSHGARRLGATGTATPSAASTIS